MGHTPKKENEQITDHANPDVNEPQHSKEPGRRGIPEPPQSEQQRQKLHRCCPTAPQACCSCWWGRALPGSTAVCTCSVLPLCRCNRQRYTPFTPEKEESGEIPRAQSCIANKTSSLTGMAQWSVVYYPLLLQCSPQRLLTLIIL